MRFAADQGSIRLFGPYAVNNPIPIAGILAVQPRIAALGNNRRKSKVLMEMETWLAPQQATDTGSKLADLLPELILAKACAPDLVVVQTTKEVHHEQRKIVQRQLLLRRGSVHGQR